MTAATLGEKPESHRGSRHSTFDLIVMNPIRMPRRHRRIRAVTGWLTAALLAWVPVVPAQQGPWDVAITIDDVPMTGGAGCRPDQIVRVNQALLDAFRDHGVRATAFVIPGTPCQGPGEASPQALVARWRAAGHDVGNHSYSHPDYNGLTVDQYLEDADRAQRFLEPLLTAARQSDRWFRPPLLHTGTTAARRDALDRWLARRHTRMGVVTIDNQEWVYAAAYARATARGDAPLSAALVAAYVDHLRRSVDYYRDLSARVFGRDVAQVLLLHANLLNGDHIDRVLDALEAAGARFVPLGEAVSDSAYRLKAPYLGPRGLSWLQRWALVRGVTPPPEPREADWVGYAASAEPELPAGLDSVLTRANDDFSRAWVAGEVARIVAAYSDDAVIHPPAGGVLATPAAVRGFWSGLPDRRGQGEHRLEPTLRRLLAPTTVLELGRWHTGVIRNGALVRETGCYTLIWRETDEGRWRIGYDAWSAPNPASWACRPR